MIKKFFSKEKSAFVVSMNNDESETAITLNSSSRKIFLNLWIDRRFDEEGELCVFLGGTSPVIPGFFNGVIRCEDRQFVVNNFGFFRRKADLTISYYDKENLYNDVLEEVLLWSEHFND